MLLQGSWKGERPRWREKFNLKFQTNDGLGCGNEEVGIRNLRHWRLVFSSLEGSNFTILLGPSPTSTPLRRVRAAAKISFHTISAFSCHFSLRCYRPIIDAL